MSTTSELGQGYERQAQAFLRQQGLRLLCCNFRCKLGEIDIIARQGDTLVFVEVRQRSQSCFGGAVYSVTPSKQRRLIRTA